MRSRTDTAHHRMASCGIKIPRSAANARPSACAISSVANTTLLVTYNRIYITMAKLAETPSVGFDFSNYARNQFLGQRLQGIPKGNTFYLLSSFTLTSHSPATSTGTTIVGVIYGGGSSGEEPGVCLGADTRATGGPIVADKNCEKVSGIYGLRKVAACFASSYSTHKLLDPLLSPSHQMLWCWYCGRYRVR